MTITLTPDIEQALTEEAKQTGADPEKLALDRLRATMKQEQPPYGLSEEERRARVRAARGSLAHLGPSSLMEDKAAEKALEERRWNAQQEDKAR